MKGLLRLAHSELQEWQETAHTNSYIPDTTSKCSKCYFQCQVGSSLLIKRFLKPLARLKVANLSPSFSQNYWEFENIYHISIEPLICGYLEPKKLSAGLQIKAATKVDKKKWRPFFVFVCLNGCHFLNHKISRNLAVQN